jgi:DNA-binding Lrp family transcriptional regulator
MTSPKDRPKIPVVKTREPGKKPGVFDNLRPPTPLPSVMSSHPIEEILGLGAPAKSEPVQIEPVQIEPATNWTGTPAKRTGPPVQVEPVQISKGGWTPWPHEFWDELALTLQPPDTVILGHLFRLTAGHKRRRCKISLPRLAERANMSVGTARTATKRLEARGLVERISVDGDSRAVDERGVEWQVNVPWAPEREGDRSKKRTGSDSAPMKEETLSETPVYSVRRIAAKFWTNRAPAYSRADLLRDLQSALIGAGIEWDDAVVEEALRPMI